MTKNKIELECRRLTVPYRSRRNKIDARCHKIGNGNNKQLKAVCLSVAGGLLLGMLALFRPSTDPALQHDHKRRCNKIHSCGSGSSCGCHTARERLRSPQPARNTLPHREPVSRPTHRRW